MTLRDDDASSLGPEVGLADVSRRVLAHPDREQRGTLRVDA